MERFKECSGQNQQTQVLRIKYFESVEKAILDVTKKRVAKLIEILN
jgi:hypothetical protein